MSASGHKPQQELSPVGPFIDEEEAAAEEEEEEHGEEEYENYDDDYEDDDDDDDDDQDQGGDEDEDEGNSTDVNYDDTADTYSEMSAIWPPPAPAPSAEASPTMPTAKWKHFVLSNLMEIGRIYLKLLIIAIVIYSAALWYVVHYDDIDSDSSKSVDAADSDTCPAGLSA